MDPDGNHANDVASSGHHSNRTSPASSIGNSTTITTVAAAAAAADHLHGTARYGNLPNPDGIHSNEINPSSSLGHHSNHTPPVSSVGYSTTIPMNTTITVLRVSPLLDRDELIQRLYSHEHPPVSTKLSSSSPLRCMSENEILEELHHSG